MLYQSFHRASVLPRFALLLLCMLMGGMGLSAQEKLKFHIEDFGLDSFDYSAKEKGYEKFDGNGDRYAIIKVTSTNPDDNLSEYNFNFGNMKHIVEEHDGVLWLYVQRNAKLVTITRTGYAPINKYDLHTTIESGRNYAMTLSSEQKRVYTQMVQFNIKPATARAIVMVKSIREDAQDEFFGNADTSGSVAKSLKYGTYTYKVLAENYNMAEGRFTLNNRGETLIEDVELKPNFSEITFTVDADADIYINGELKGTRQWSGTLQADTYQVECRQANHKPTSQNVRVTVNDNRTITLKAPEPILGTASVTSSPLGALMQIDGRSYGLTPKNIDLPIGSHTIMFSKQNYRTEFRTFEVEEDATVEVSVLLQLASGKTQTAKTPPAKPKVVKTPKPKDSSAKKTDFYIEAGFGLGSSMNVTAAVGANISAFNLEAYYSYSFSKSPEIYWYPFVVNEGESEGYDTCSYSPSLILGAKAGFGFNVGSGFRLTPQAGYRFTKLTEKGSDDVHINGAYCSAATIGMRAHWALSPHFGLSITPEYAIGVAKSEGFKTLSDVTPKIKNLGEGFNVKLGLTLTF